MAGTTQNKPQILQHAKTIHRPLISFILVEGLFLSAPVNSFSLTQSELQPILDTAGRNGTEVPNEFSPDIDTQGVVVDAENNRCIVYESGSQNIPHDPVTGREVYARIVPAIKNVDNYRITFYILDDNGDEQAYIMPIGTYDYFIPYRFSFEYLPDDAIIRVKSRRSNDDPAGGGKGGREVMQLITVLSQNILSDLLFKPIENSNVWMHITGYAIESLSSALQRTGKTMVWDNSVANFDLEQGDRVVVHYETYE